ncbi:MAG: FAD-dependent oxidoreductase [Kiritimatiellaeota bacterium]|nr:FAD-dependent oxidoreductase [Kiritimatiellota bacterium]
MKPAPTVEFSKQIDVRHEVDVFVAGGGPAGVTAAVAAARLGKSVFLVEAQGAFGGMGTLGLVPVFMTFGDGVRTLAAGLGAEIRERLAAAGGTGPSPNGILPEVLKRVYDEMIEEAGVVFRFYTNLIGTIQTEGRVRMAVLAAKSGIYAVRARVFVDGTGDGDLAVMAGASFEKGDPDGNLMPGTLCSQWKGIDWERYAQWRRRHPGSQGSELQRAFENDVFTQKDLHLPGIFRLGADLGGGNIGHLYGIDNTDEATVTRAMVFGRKLVLEYEKYYKDYLRGFEQMTLTQTGALPGIRETRRIMGDYVLTLEDFRDRAVFPDEIGRYCYPVDIHPSRPDPTAYAKFEREFTKDLRYAPGESYGVPYRTLTPRDLENVLVAGRCISCDRYVQGSIRVMPGCFITGQAAGTAAALAVDAGSARTRDVDVATLRNTLREAGAYIPGQ